MSTFAEEIGFDDDSVSSNKFEKYQGKKGYTDRIGMCLLNPQSGKPIVKKVLSHYIEGAGYVKANDYTIAKYGEPSLRLGTVIVQYATDKNGKLEQPFRYTTKFFIFSAKKYELLKKANSEFPLESHDLLVTCTEQEYQNLSFNSCKEAAWKLKPELKKQVEEAATRLAASLDRQLAQDLTVQQLKEKLGEDSAPAAAEETSLNPDDVIANL